VDEKDFEIIKILDYNARTSYSKIANKINLSIRGVSLRIERLLNDKVIKRFTVIFNVNLLGFRHYIFSISPIKSKKILTTNLLDNLKKIHEINQLWQFHNDIFILSVFCKNTRQLELILSKLSTLEIKMNRYEEARAYMPDNYPFSVIDWKIINFLQDNARAGKSEIAKALNVSQKTVMRRMERMKNMKLVRFSLELNFEAIEGMITALISFETERNYKDVFRIVKNDPAIKFWRSAGTVSPSIVLFVYAKSITDIYEIYSKIKNQKDVRSVSLDFIVHNWDNSTIIKDAILTKIR